MGKEEGVGEERGERVGYDRGTRAKRRAEVRAEGGHTDAVMRAT